MRKIAYFLTLSALAIIITQCGGDKGAGENPTTNPSTTPTPTVAPTEGKMVVLSLFASTTCTPCKKELPEIQNRLPAEFGDKAKNVHVRVFVTSAKTPEQAKQFGDSLGVNFEMIPDVKAGGVCTAKYAEYFPENENCVIPAAAIHAKDESAKTLFPAGKAKVDSLFAELKRRLE